MSTRTENRPFHWYFSLTLRQLEWASIVLPLVFLGLYYYLMLGPFPVYFHSWYGFGTLWVLLAAAVLGFARSVFGAFRGMQSEIRLLNEETRKSNEGLFALHEVNLALARETEIHVVLRRVTELSARLTGARYAALAVVDSDGKIIEFQSVGLSPEQEAAMADWPGQTNFVGNLLQQPDALIRIDDLRAETPEAGFPEGLPEMTTFLGVPVVHLGTVVGALYMANKDDDETFSELDADIVRMFASHAGAVIQNARLYEDVAALAVEREREQIAREMHDGLAQVLSFVNTKAQAVEQLLENDDPAAARRHVAELSKAARDVYTDIREGIVALHAQAGDDRSLRDVLDAYVEEFRHFAKLDVTVDWGAGQDDFDLPARVDVQVLRIVQEALSNVRRHAKARSATVTFEMIDGTLVLSVRDDGDGFDPSSLTRGEWPRFDLQAMRERAEAVGGTLTVESAPGRGTTICARFPGVVSSPVASYR